ncbi:MAG TPA: hypothetical protein VEW69_02400 [Alphaproteobacteria bacterium]|jgi:hypothetical protein|nr:hypothetical protein [Alphaproteobacteria bacterium]
MGEVVYVSNSRIERHRGPIRYAYIAGEPQRVIFSVHGAIAEYYGRKAEELGDPHAATIDYVIAAVGA